MFNSLQMMTFVMTFDGQPLSGIAYSPTDPYRLAGIITIAAEVFP
jgi:hypothetical protein